MPWISLRTAISGFVPLLLIARILALRSLDERVSTLPYLPFSTNSHLLFLTCTNTRESASSPLWSFLEKP